MPGHFRRSCVRVDWRLKCLHTAEVGGSSPSSPTRCQKCNVSPGRVPFRVSDRSGTFVFVFKPLPMQAQLVDRSWDRRDRGSGLSKHADADRQ